MYNRVILMGRLVADPELCQTQSGIAMCRLRVAVDRGFAKQGEERQSDFINVTCWKQTAEFVSRYFSKGRMIHVEGRLQNNDYTDQNGVKHYSMDVVADNVTFCGDKSNNQNGYHNQQQNPYQNQYQPPQQHLNRQPQQYQQPMHASPAPPPAIGDMSDFEEILSDGDTPF